MKFHSRHVVAQAAKENLGQLLLPAIVLAIHNALSCVFCTHCNIFSQYLPKSLLWRCHNVVYECVVTVKHIVD